MKSCQVGGPVDPGYFAGAIIWRRCKDGQFEFLVQECRYLPKKYSRQGRQLKFPGGGNKDKFGEKNPVDTTRREVWEEVFLTWNKSSEMRMTSRPSRDGHVKIFFLIHEADLVGNIRKGILLDGDSLIYPPKWMRAEDVLEHIHSGHHKPLECALEHLESLVSA